MLLGDDEASINYSLEFHEVEQTSKIHVKKYFIYKRHERNLRDEKVHREEKSDLRSNFSRINFSPLGVCCHVASNPLSTVDKLLQSLRVENKNERNLSGS